MSGEGYSILLRCRSWGEALRAKRFTWDQIAYVIALVQRVGPLRCYRLAHGRTAVDVVDAINDLDPAGTASMRECRLYDFEGWPAAGRRPTARVLAALARVYQTRAHNLISDEEFSTYSVYDRDVIDQADFRHLDPFQPVTVCSVPQQRVSMDEKAHPERPRQDIACDTARNTAEAATLSVGSCKELLRAVNAEEADMKRRELLLELSFALGGAPAMTLLRHLDPDEEERLARMIQAQGHVDAKSVATLEKLTAQCRRLDDTYGPAKVLPVVEAQRDLVARLLGTQSLLPGLRTRLVHTYAELAQLAGFLHFDRMDYHAAARSLDRGLEAAQESGDPVLTAYIHHWYSEMAYFARQPAKTLDHAFAAQGWARRGGSNLMRSRADTVEALAHALTGNAKESLRKVEAARSWADSPTSSEPSYLYWVNAYQGVGTSFWFIFNDLGRSADVIEAVTTRLAALSPAFKREKAFGLIQHGMALTQSKEIPEATAKFSEAITLMREHSSARLGLLITQARKRLEPWSGNTYVRDLDESLRSAAIV
ncbi:hypothetical protein AB0K60_07800 [Thermopolyspora sp. NPDC052614]|uniref:hypothetical protein n=1 Tax=Thermopolyspora sp. NPDC052614 TaxID=3155682 RepID=UPI00343E6754